MSYFNVCLNAHRNPYIPYIAKKNNKNEKRSEKTLTLRAGCSKAEPKIFASPQTPLTGVQDGQNGDGQLPSPTDPVW